MAVEECAYIKLSCIRLGCMGNKTKTIEGDMELRTYIKDGVRTMNLNGVELPGDGVTHAALDSLFDDLEDLIEATMRTIPVDVVSQVPVVNHA